METEITVKHGDRVLRVIIDDGEENGIEAAMDIIAQQFRRKFVNKTEVEIDYGPPQTQIRG